MLIKIKCQCRKITWNGFNALCKSSRKPNGFSYYVHIYESNRNFEWFFKWNSNVTHFIRIYVNVHILLWFSNHVIPYSKVVFVVGHFFCFHFHWNSIENKNPLKFHQTRNEFSLLSYSSICRWNVVFIFGSFVLSLNGEYECEGEPKRKAH